MWLSLLKIKNNAVYVSGLTVRNDKYDRNGKEVNVILKKKCYNLNKNLSFNGNENINPRMLNKSGLHLNKYGTTQLLKSCYDHMNKWREKSVWTTMLEEEKICGFKKIKEKICLKSWVANNDRHIISKTNHLEENLDYANRLKIVKNAGMGFNQFRNTGCKTLGI